MPKQRYQQKAPTHDWQQIRPLLNDPAHITYEMLRYVIVWGEALKERAAVDGNVEALNRLLERLKVILPPGKTQQHASQPSISAVEQVRRFQAYQGEKEGVK